jgi:hypothetical protein
MRTSNIQELMQFINNKRSEYIFAVHFFFRGDQTCSFNSWIKSVYI